jgi:hypothetical protein
MASQTFTYTAEDLCGNIAPEQTVTYTWKEDTEPPTITCPPAQYLKCGDSIEPSTTGTATATDNCEGDITITYADEVIEDETSSDCATQIIRTWTATDECGNEAYCEQIICVKSCCETAFADTTNIRGTTSCYPFGGSERWGWFVQTTAGQLAGKTITLPMYYGAANCMGGTQIGTVTMTFDSAGLQTISFSTMPEDWHVWLSYDSPRTTTGFEQWDQEVPIPLDLSKKQQTIYLSVHATYCEIA